MISDQWSELVGPAVAGLAVLATLRLHALDRLRQRLQKAIAEEEYEQAARLRDSIRALTAQLAENEKQTDIKVAPPKRIVAEDAEGGEFDD